MRKGESPAWPIEQLCEQVHRVQEGQGQVDCDNPVNMASATQHDINNQRDGADRQEKQKRDEMDEEEAFFTGFPSTW